MTPPSALCGGAAACGAVQGGAGEGGRGVHDAGDRVLGVQPRQVGNNLGVAVLGSIVTARTRAPDGAGFATASHPGWWILATAGRVAARFPADPVPAVSSTPAVRGGTQT